MNGNDWANILGEPTFEQKWAASLANIGIFPTEKIYGKDIQTPTIGMEPPAGVGFTAEQQREINERWARIDREKQEEQERRRREEEEKRKRGGVSLEEYNRRIASPENWKLEQGRWRWIGATGGGGYAELYEWRQKKELEKKYPEVTNYDKEVSKYMRTNEYQSLGAKDKLNFYKETQAHRSQLKDKIDKKLQVEKVAREKLEAKIPPEQMRIYIKAVDTGQMSKGALAYILAEQGYPDDYIDNITAGLRDRLTVDENIKIENQRRKWIEEDREYPYDEVVKLRQQYQETEDYTLYAAGLQNLGLTKDERNELLPVKLSALEELDVIEKQGAVAEATEDRRIRAELKKLYPEMVLEGWSFGDLQELKLKYKEYELRIEAGEREQGRDDLNDFVQRKTLDFKQEQATIKQQNWVTEQADKLAVFEEDKKRDIRDFGAEEADRIFKRKQITLDYLEKVRVAESNEAITKDRDLKNYTIAGIKEEHSWVQAMHTMGLKDKDFIQSAYEFTMTMDWWKEKEETRAREFGQTYRLDVTQEAAIQDRFEKELAVELARLNNTIATDWADLSLRAGIKPRIETMATLTYSLKVKQLGKEGAKRWLDDFKKDKEWWLQEELLELDNTEANSLYIETMSRVADDTIAVGLEQALSNANTTIMKNQLRFEYGLLEKQDAATRKLSSDLTTTLSNMPDYQEYAIKVVGSAYNDKTGKFYEPSRTEINEVSDFLFGAEKDEEREQVRFGVNLNTEDYVEQCLNTFGWSDKLKGWCIKNRDDLTLWNIIIATGTANDSYIPPEIEEAIKKPGWFDRGLGGALRGIGETFKNWFTFTEPVIPGVELTPRVTRTGNIATDAENILTQYGQDISRNDMRKYLSDMGYNEAEINSILGG